MAVVDGLDVQVAADPLAGRLVQRLMADAEVGGAPRIGSGAVGDEQSILVDGGFQHRLDGFGRHLRQRPALSVVPLRSAAPRIGTCSRDRPRLAALPPRLRG